MNTLFSRRDISEASSDADFLNNSKQKERKEHAKNIEPKCQVTRPLSSIDSLLRREGGGSIALRVADGSCGTVETLMTWHRMICRWRRWVGDDWSSDRVIGGSRCCGAIGASRAVRCRRAICNGRTI